MSRNIQVPKKSTVASESIRNTEGGKLIFTTYQNRPFAFLLRRNRLMAAQAFSAQESAIGAIYIGKVRKVTKNIESYFVEIANGETCFLPMKETLSDTPLREGDELPVQIVREAQKTKQASVTTRLSLSNDYVAISLGSPKIGFSNKLSEGRKEELRGWLQEAGYMDKKHCFSCAPIADKSNFKLSKIGIVIRTKAQTCNEEELLSGIKQLTEEFIQMLQQAEHRACFSCIRKAPSAYEEILDKMVYSYEYEEIVTDDPALYESLQANPVSNKPVRLYDDPSFSLTKLYSLESKMKTALERRVWLTSGGYLVIDHTEALTVIDVNSGKYEAKKTTADDTAWLTNREAADEIALQLRLRNLSGIIIVDFINLQERSRQEELLKRLRERTKQDKLKTVVHDMTALGLVEITRKKQHKTLREQVGELKG